MRLQSLIIVAFLTFAAAAVAQAPTARGSASKLADIFEAANVAASRGDHAGAIARYVELAEAGVRDPDVYFNLATSLAQSGDYPRAILYYERTLMLRPSDSSAAKNLRDAEQALEEERAEAEGEAMIQRSSSISEAIYGRFAEDALAYALLAANLLFFTGLAWAWVRRRRARGLYLLITASGLVLLLSALGLAAKAGLFRDGPRAVVLEDRVALREGPDPRARIRGEARGGDRGELVDRDGEFVKLRVITGLEGWAPDTAVGSVDPGYTAH